MSSARKRMAAFAVLCGIIAVAASGCASAAPVIPRLSVKVFQYRSDYAVRQLQIEVTNHGRADVTVTAARVSSALFGGEVASKSTPNTLFAGSALDFRVTLPAAACDVTAAKTSTVIVFSTKDGSSHRITRTPTDPFGALALVHKQDCGRVEFEKIATITPAATVHYTTVDGRQVAHIDLAIRPTGAGGSVTLESIQDTTLLSQVEGPLRPIGLTFTAASAPTIVTVNVVPSRCEAHVIAEDKVGTLIPLHATVPAFGEVAFSVPVSLDMKNELYRYVDEYCGL